MRFHLFANRKLKLWLSSCLLFACLHVNADEPESRRSQAIKFAGRKDNVGQSRGRNMSRRRTEDRPNLDDRLRRLLVKNGVEELDSPKQNPIHVELGQALFFDRILSGNRDTACATCHHPLTATADGLSLGVGTGTETLGSVSLFRIRGEGRSFVPRNAPDLFNRGSDKWHTAFWDGRVSVEDGVVRSPAGDQLPSELVTPLQIQAMFPVTSRDEMRGDLEDVEYGNELAAIDDADFTGIWDALMVRLLSNETYREMFARAFPEVPEHSLGFQHAAIALAAFEAEAFGMTDSPFDQYLAGDSAAMTKEAKRGAAIFYGSANCSSCHSGSLLTDQQHHNLAVPQLGPGKDPVSGLDFGRFGITGAPSDLFKFRTPALRNVTATGPWMHNGAYSDLEDVIRHHVDPEDSLDDYDPYQQLFQSDLWDLVVQDEDLDEWMLESFEEDLESDDREDDEEDEDDDQNRSLSPKQIRLLIAFLDSLTAPDLQERLLWVVPSSVPSGLLEDGIPEVD